jgi:hypothetical protein
MLVVLVVHLTTKPISRTYVIDGKNVSKSEFEKIVADNGLKPEKDKRPSFGLHTIYNYVK